LFLAADFPSPPPRLQTSGFRHQDLYANRAAEEQAVYTLMIRPIRKDL
jgi:hypothetical protein